jgi:hypothetical protein
MPNVFFLNQNFNIQVVNIMLSKKPWRSQITQVIIDFNIYIIPIQIRNVNHLQTKLKIMDGIFLRNLTLRILSPFYAWSNYYLFLIGFHLCWTPSLPKAWLFGCHCFLFMDSCHVSCSPFLIALLIDMLFMINLIETNNELQQKFQNTNLCLSMLNTIMLMYIKTHCKGITFILMKIKIWKKPC